jgi:hypothetical protein
MQARCLMPPPTVCRAAALAAARLKLQGTAFETPLDSSCWRAPVLAVLKSDEWCWADLWVINKDAAAAGLVTCTVVGYSIDSVPLTHT